MLESISAPPLLAHPGMGIGLRNWANDRLPFAVSSTKGDVRGESLGYPACPNSGPGRVTVTPTDPSKRPAWEGPRDQRGPSSPPPPTPAVPAEPETTAD